MKEGEDMEEEAESEREKGNYVGSNEGGGERLGCARALCRDVSVFACVCRLCAQVSLLEPW